MGADAHPAWATLFDIAELSTLQLEEGVAISPPVRPYYVVGDESLAGITYSITPSLPAGLHLDPANGRIAGTPLMAGAGDGRLYRISISRFGGEVFATSIAVDVARRLRSAPGIVPPLVPGQWVAPFRPVVASDGVQPYWYQISPPLPPGLTLDPETGEVSGLPDAAVDVDGAREYLVSVQDAFGVQASTRLHFSSSPRIPPLVLTVIQPMISLKTGVAVVVTPVTAQGMGPFSFRASSLPRGLSINPGTGEISGTISQAFATREVGIVVTDLGTGREAVATFNLYATADLVVEVPVPVISLPVATPVVFRPVEVRGIGPFRYTADALPEGLVINENMGDVTGRLTPTSPAMDITIAITDVGAGRTQAASFRIQPVVALSAEVRMAEVVLEIGVDVARLWPVKALSPAGIAITYAITPNLPANLSLDPATGEILGRPLAVMAEAPFEISMTTAQGGVVRRSFSLRVVSTFAAADDTAETEHGSLVAIPVTHNDGPGPFVALSIETVPEHGTVQPLGLNVIYRPDPEFSGTDSFLYRVDGTGGRSAAARVMVKVAPARPWQPPVMPPPDPATVASAIEVINMQTRSALRFAEAQIDNFASRLQDLHRQQPAAARLRFAGITSPDPLGPVRFAGELLPGDAGWPAKTSGLASAPGRREEKRAGSRRRVPYQSRAAQSRRLSFWSGGTLLVGTEAKRAGPERIIFGTQGYSGGVDYVLDPSLTLGLGLGVGDEDMATDTSDLMVFSVSTDGVFYGSWRPASGSGFYLDGLIGYGRILHVSTRQPLDSEGPAVGTRMGSRTFGALYLGHELRGDFWRLAPFVALSGIEGRLGAFQETGSPKALDYRRETVRAYRGHVGLAADLRLQVIWLVIAPRVQVEWRQSLRARHHSDIGWATAPDGPRVIRDEVERGTAQLSVSAGLVVENGPFAMSIDWQGIDGDQHYQSRSVRTALTVRF